MTTKCAHENGVEFFHAEPDLGYGAYFQCLDCDATTTEWTDEADVEDDGDGYVSVMVWQEPVWEDEDE